MVLNSVDINAERKDVDPAERTIEFLERTGFIDLVSDKDKFNDWLQNLTFETAQDYFIRINGLVRGMPIKDRSFDGDGVEIKTVFGNTGLSSSEYIPPKTEHKKELLEKVFTTLKSDIPDSDKAKLVFYTTEAIHAFSDGNGRNGRLLYYLFNNIGNSEAFTSDKLYALISHNCGNDTGTEGRQEIEKEIASAENFFYSARISAAYNELDHEFFSKYSSGIRSGLQTDDGYTTAHLSPNIARELLSLIEKGRYKTLDLALTRFLRKNNLLEKYLRKGELVNKTMCSFDADILFNDIDDSQAQEIIANFWDLKYKFVEAMIAMFTNPVLKKFKEGACKPEESQ